MLKYFIYLCITFLFITESSSSQNIILDYDVVFNLIDFNNKIVPHFYYRKGTTDLSGHYDLSVLDSTLYVTNLQLFDDSDTYGAWMRIYSYVKFKVDLTDMKIEIEDIGKGDAFAGNLIYDVSSAIVDSKSVIIEPRHKNLWVNFGSGKSPSL